MKLVSPEYNISLTFEENKAVFLIIEEKRVRLELVDALYQQCMGEDGSFILSEGTQILKMSKTADILMNPFSLDYNDRKVLTRLYQEIETCGNEDFYEEKEKLNRDIIVFLDKIMLNLPYNIVTKLELDLTELCKLYQVRLENTGNTLVEKLVEYIKIMNQLCSVKLFIMLNFTLYLDKEEMNAICEFASYQKVHLLFVEYIVPVDVENKSGCIIDEDRCIIELGN